MPGSNRKKFATWGWASKLGILLSLLVNAILFVISLREYTRTSRTIPPWALFLVLWTVLPSISWLLYALSNLAPLEERKRHKLWDYPRWTWDVRGWWVSSLLLWTLVHGFSIFFFARFGVSSSPSFSIPRGDPETEEYRRLLFFSLLSSSVQFVKSLQALWAEGFESYPLTEVKVREPTLELASTFP